MHIVALSSILFRICREMFIWKPMGNLYNGECHKLDSSKCNGSTFETFLILILVYVLSIMKMKIYIDTKFVTKYKTTFNET